MSSGDDTGFFGFLSKFIKIEGLGFDAESLGEPIRVIRFRPVALIMAIIGGYFLAVFSGLVNFILAIGRGATSIYGGIQGALTSLVIRLFGAERVVLVGTASSEVAVTAGGIAAFALAIAVVGVTAYLINLVRELNE